MKTQIKQAPNYTIENGIVYNSKDEVMTEENGIVRLTVDGLRRQFKVADLTPVESVIEEKKEKEPGVIKTILNLIKSGEVTEEMIINSLVVKFPQKAKESMSKTVRAQLGGKLRPVRMEKENNITFKIETREGVKYYSV